MKPNLEAPNLYRVKEHRFISYPEDGMNGCFLFERKVLGKGVVKLFVIASDGLRTGWEHVSVSVRNYDRLPTWDEMCFIKDKFWTDNEVVVQFHPKKQDYVDNFQVLHLWRKVDFDYETPPTYLV